MRRIVIGAASGIVIWLGAALAAEAQIDIKPTGPQAVVSGQTSSTYTAVVTCNRNFYLNLKVFLNGVQKYYSTTYTVNSGPSYNYSKVVNMTGWGHQAGDTLIYRGKAYYGGTVDQEDWTVIVSGTTYLVPSRIHCVELDRDREEWA